MHPSIQLFSEEALSTPNRSTPHRVIFQDQFVCDRCEENSEKFRIKECEMVEKTVKLLLANAYNIASWRSHEVEASRKPSVTHEPSDKEIHHH